MEEPTFTAIDYNSLENKVIEGLVRDNYSKIKNTFYRVFDKRVKNPNSPVGLCADLIEASRYKDDSDGILWRKVIKSWFTPQRFNITYVYFGYSTPLIQHLKEEILRLTEEVWNRFSELPINHPMEMNEMAIKIHDIQRMIISRPGFRMNQEMFRQYGNGNCNKG